MYRLYKDDKIVNHIIYDGQECEIDYNIGSLEPKVYIAGFHLNKEILLDLEDIQYENEGNFEIKDDGVRVEMPVFNETIFNDLRLYELFHEYSSETICRNILEDIVIDLKYRTCFNCKYYTVEKDHGYCSNTKSMMFNIIKLTEEMNTFGCNKFEPKNKEYKYA